MIPQREVAISVRELSKSFGDCEVLRGISVQIEEGEVVAILGSSGSGKSTFLRIINGLEPFQAGELKIFGNSIKAAKQSPKIPKGTGMVFQSFELFPHLTIIENLTLAPKKVLGLRDDQAKEMATSLLRRVDILDQADKYPSQLSGGQKQRASIARALMMQPKILLCDEPTSALDPEMTGEILDVLKGLAYSGITLVIVTHEVGFAKLVADRILFFGDAGVLEDARTQDFFNNPVHEKVQSYLRKVL